MSEFFKPYSAPEADEDMPQPGKDRRRFLSAAGAFLGFNALAGRVMKEKAGDKMSRGLENDPHLSTLKVDSKLDSYLHEFEAAHSALESMKEEGVNAGEELEAVLDAVPVNKAVVEQQLQKCFDLVSQQAWSLYQYTQRLQDARLRLVRRDNQFSPALFKEIQSRLDAFGRFLFQIEHSLNKNMNSRIERARVEAGLTWPPKGRSFKE